MDSNVITIGFSSSPEFTGNVKALYENLKKRNLKKYKLVWVVENIKQKENLEKLDLEVICKKDENFYDEFKKIQIMCITHDQFIDDKLESQIFISLWHGIGPKKTGYSLNNEIETEFAEKYNKLIDYICVPSEFSKMLFSYIFNFDNNKIIITPYQRNMYLFESNGIDNIKKILKNDIKKFNKILLYAPTFRKGIGREDGSINKNNILNLLKYNEDILNEYLEKNNYALIIKLHPSEENSINKEMLSNNIFIMSEENMKKNNITINEILNGVDCLITDYSSIYTDYLLLNRPVIFLNTDIEEYNKKRGIYFESESFWYPGPVVNNINDFIENIQKLIEDEEFYKIERDNFIKIVNKYNNDDINNFLDEFILKIEPKIKIPKIIHYFVDEKINQINKENIEQWKKILVGYEFKEWNINSRDIQKIIKEENINLESIQLVKLAIIKKIGGVFLDTDIQIMKDIEHLLIEDEKILVMDEYKNPVNKIVGGCKDNKFIKECLDRKWYGINKGEEKYFYRKKDLFVSIEEQHRIGKPEFQDDDKYFNDTNITLKNKIGRALKYGFLIGK